MPVVKFSMSKFVLIFRSKQESGQCFYQDTRFQHYTLLFLGLYGFLFSKIRALFRCCNKKTMSRLLIAMNRCKKRLLFGVFYFYFRAFGLVYIIDVF